MTVLITGGAGFIGANVAHALLSAGEPVRILDDLSRIGVERNVRWLEAQHGPRLELLIADVRDPAAVARALAGVDHVFHFAAQVAVTTSIDHPRLDFDINAGGTLNLLESIRMCARPPSLVYTSTNKVYGGLEDVTLRQSERRYEPENAKLAASGISEERPLSFCSPYGCSKGTADQYVLDYAHTFGLRAAVFRMSCIYGPRQLGNEDQGWVAHFLLRALRDEPISIFGDGRQVRDVLYVDDLVDALVRARSRIGVLSGRAFNIGGGPTSTTSLVELVERITRLTGRSPHLVFEPWRRADQRWYVSDVSSVSAALGWSPRTGLGDGVGQLFEWLSRQDVVQTGPARTRSATEARSR